MKGLDLLITMSVIISFSVSIFVSYIITNNKNLQTDTVCDINCNIVDNYDGSSGDGDDPINQFLLDPGQFAKDIVGSSSDPPDDTQLITLDKTAQIPVIHGFYDIVSTQITKMYNDDLIFTINLEDDPNKNRKYETTYLWVLSRFDPLNDKNQIYTLIIPQFGIDSNFKNKGWYLAIYDNINSIYSLPLSRINNMVDNNVEISIDPKFIGNINNFNYTTAIMIRVNDTFLDKRPDYLVDSSPDNDAFWSGWFI